MTDINCNIINDLLPLYAEGLTSEESNRIIEEHLKECEECRKLYQEMTEDVSCVCTGGYDASTDDDAAAAQNEAEAIDFMKKSNRRLKRGSVFTAVAVVALILCLLLARGFFRTYTVPADTVMLTQVQVSEHEATIAGCLSDSAKGIKAKSVSFDNGVLSIMLKSSLVSFLTENDFLVDFTTTEEIKTVKIGDEVVWDGGTVISRDTGKLFAAKHPYIGDMTANSRSINALDINQKLGAFENELQTVTEPYGWILHLQNDMSDRNQDKLNEQLGYYSAMLIATIDNLDYVQFVYYMDGAEQCVSFSEDYVDSIYGSSVKAAARTAAGLSGLMTNW